MIKEKNAYGHARTHARTQSGRQTNKQIHGNVDKMDRFEKRRVSGVCKTRTTFILLRKPCHAAVSLYGVNYKLHKQVHRCSVVGTAVRPKFIAGGGGGGGGSEPTNTTFNEFPKCYVTIEGIIIRYSGQWLIQNFSLAGPFLNASFL